MAEGVNEVYLALIPHPSAVSFHQELKSYQLLREVTDCLRSSCHGWPEPQCKLGETQCPNVIWRSSTGDAGTGRPLDLRTTEVFDSVDIQYTYIHT